MTFRSLFGLAWKKSPAHLLLLSRFLYPTSGESYSRSDSWEDVLGEHPEKAIRRFVEDGALEPVGLAELLDRKFKVPALKEMLKQRGLPPTGQKKELITRLLQADPEEMKKATSDLVMWRCSEQGKAIAEERLAREKEKRLDTEGRILGALQKGRFREAIEAVASFEVGQVFQRGMGIDWKNYTPDRDLAILDTIFRGKPKILAALPDEQMQSFRITAAMMHLWGGNRAQEWLPSGLETGLVLGGESAARMILFYALHQQKLSNYRKGDIKKVKILTAKNRVCEACQKLEGKIFAIDQAPELPHEKCTSETGCRCTMVAQVVI